MRVFLSAITAATIVVAAPQNAAKPGSDAPLTPDARRCINVGPNSKYTTIQSGVDAVDEKSEKPCVFVRAGTYSERVTVKETLNGLSIYGETKNKYTWSSNTVTIVASASAKQSGNNQKSATMIVHGPNFRMYNVNVVNKYGHPFSESQAVALAAMSDSGFYGCQISGEQDTLLTERGTQLYASCMIKGNVDFIFGLNSRAWFQKPQIQFVPRDKGYITAQNRQSQIDLTANWVINGGEVISAPDSSSSVKHSLYLGRPWGPRARVTFQRVALSDIVNPEGWSIWDEKSDISQLEFGEFKNTGPGADDPVKSRRKIGRQLDKEIPISAVLGDDFSSKPWYDKDYMQSTMKS